MSCKVCSVESVSTVVGWQGQTAKSARNNIALVVSVIPAGASTIKKSVFSAN
jgi:hypothetical protein